MLYPDKFEYARPRNLGSALELISKVRNHLVIAGGTVGVLMLKRRVLRPEIVVDIARIPELGGTSLGGSGVASIGATTRISELERATASSASPSSLLLSAAARAVGDVALRSMGTVGGNVSLGDPSNDLPPALMVMDAVAVIAGPGGVRRQPLRSLYRGSLSTAMGPDELLLRVEFREVPARHSWYYGKRTIRSLDHSVASAAALGSVVDGSPVDLRIALGGRAFAAPRALDLDDVRGARPPVVVDEVVARAKSACSCTSDAYGTAAYKSAVVESLVEDALSALGVRTR
ncbi:MAG: FAD binding domain-containing protein [Conexivisphaera sp.]